MGMELGVHREILAGAHRVLLVFVHIVQYRDLYLIRVWIWPCEEQKERVRLSIDKEVILIMGSGI